MHKHASMNRSYRLVWSQVHACWVAVAEGSRGRGKGSGRKLAAVLLANFLGALSPGALAAPPLPNALPSGAQLVAGQASVATAGNRLTVTQSTAQAILNWQRFDIGANATVRFDQPSAAAVALNRVLATDPSQIYGQLSSNGQVFLINPQGFLFGAGAQVNVGGLVASSLAMSDQSFLSGSYRFARDGSAGAVRNEGSISVARGGSVALLGPSVSNAGSINAPQGSVTLAAGEQMALDMRGDGLITVRVGRGALNALAENKGLIAADGGQVLLTAVAADALPDDVASAIAAAMAEADPQAKIDLALDCPACGHAWTNLLDIAGFLWREVDAWARRTLLDIHTLARAYGWSEAQILALTTGRRDLYLAMLRS